MSLYCHIVSLRSVGTFPILECYLAAWVLAKVANLNVVPQSNLWTLKHLNNSWEPYSFLYYLVSSFLVSPSFGHNVMLFCTLSSFCYLRSSFFFVLKIVISSQLDGHSFGRLGDVCWLLCGGSCLPFGIILNLLWVKVPPPSFQTQWHWDWFQLLWVLLPILSCSWVPWVCWLKSLQVESLIFFKLTLYKFMWIYALFKNLLWTLFWWK